MRRLLLEASFNRSRNEATVPYLQLCLNYLPRIVHDISTYSHIGSVQTRVAFASTTEMHMNLTKQCTCKSRVNTRENVTFAVFLGASVLAKYLRNWFSALDIPALSKVVKPEQGGEGGGGTRDAVRILSIGKWNFELSALPPDNSWGHNSCTWGWASVYNYLTLNSIFQNGLACLKIIIQTIKFVAKGLPSHFKNKKRSFLCLIFMFCLFYKRV